MKRPRLSYLHSPHSGHRVLIPGLPRNLIRVVSLNKTQRHRVTEFSFNYNLCILEPLCLYLQEIADQVRDEGIKSAKRVLSLRISLPFGEGRGGAPHRFQLSTCFRRLMKSSASVLVRQRGGNRRRVLVPAQPVKQCCSKSRR